MASTTMPTGRASREPRRSVFGTAIDAALRYAVPVAIALVAVGVALRFVTTSHLWLDEALSVNIAKLPLRQLPGALRHDGAPPLYYVMLHLWIRFFGDGDFAVRALSGVVSLVTLPLAWSTGKALGGRRLAWAALILMASSPFAVSYATATRMYSLMILWSLLGFLVLSRALEAPSRRRLVLVGAVTSLLLYTHYWAIYLVAVTSLWLLFRARRRITVANRLTAGSQRASWLCFVAIVVGSLTFLPWAPSFVFQTLHTGTPWANPAGFGDILSVLGQYGGGGPWGAALGLTLYTLVLLGIFGRSIDANAVMLDLRTRWRARPIAVVFLGTLLVAVLCGVIANAAFSGRYTAVVFPLFILLASFGASVFADRRVLAAVLAWAAIAGLIVGIDSNLSPRTEAGVVADVINAEASPNDLVVYCPDQLAPAVARLLTVRVQQVTFPRGTGPQRIDWVDYRKAYHDADALRFARTMVSDAAGHDIWYVWSPSYPGTDRKCATLLNWLTNVRSNGQNVVSNDGATYYEHEALVRFPE